MIGILAEKPSAAKNFAKALGGMQGTYRGESYTIVAARGHLYEYVPPDKQVDAQYYDQMHVWNLANLPWDERLFQWKRERKEDTRDTLNTIKNTLKGCSEVVIATDDDPSGEGELLAWEILDELNIRNKRFTRMYFTDESVKEVQRAFVQRKVLPPMRQDMDFVKAEFRSQWDMLSMQFTRIATVCAGNQAVLRQGRLKSVMVQMTGDGLKAVKEYKRVPFYQNKFRDDHGVIYSNPEEPRFASEDQVPQIYHDSEVVCDGKQMKAQAPPRLMDLAALSSRLSPMGYKASTVLSVYQKMYEAQVVSYPRTEDKVITPEQFQDLLPLVDRIASVVGVDASLLTHRTPRATHVKTGGAHGANRPGPNVPVSLQDLKRYGDCGPVIYELLAKNYLAMLCEDYRYESQKGHLKDYPKFTGTASVPKFAGWKQVFADDIDPSEDENAQGLGMMASPFVAEGANPKPPTPTMKWLMKQLEKYDVGTGATRTSTYAEVTSTSGKYPLLKESKGKLSMTEFGDMSYILLAGTVIGDVKTTENLQKQMRDIAEGTAVPADCLRQVQEFVRHDLNVMQQNAKQLHITGGGTTMATPAKEKYRGTFKGKPVAFNIEWGGHRFTEDECQRLLAGESIVIDAVSRKGDPMRVKGNLAEQEYNGHKFYGFNRLEFVNDGSVPKKFSGHTFTDDEYTQLCAGKSLHLENLVSRKGSKYSATIHWDEDLGKFVFE